MRFLKSAHKTSQSDEALIEDFIAGGDLSCIEILFNRYCHLVVAVAMNYLHDEEESKDVVLEIFEKVPADLKKYRVKDFSKWIYIVTKNHCYHRLKKNRHFTSSDATPEISEADETDESNELLVRHLDESMQTLPEHQRTCIRLFYLEEKSYEEIMSATGFSYNEVKSYIQNGKRNLKNYLSRFRK